MSETNAEQGFDAVTEQALPIPEQRTFEGRRSFETPSWMAPRTSETQRVPAQAEPEHDTFVPPMPRPTRDVAIPSEAHWTERAKPRLLAGTLLTVSLVGAVACLVFTVTTQSVVAIAGLVGCAVVAVIFRGGLMSAGVTTVELKGATLKVRRNGVLDIFNLADPIHQATMSGTPGEANWRLRMEALGGRVVELTSAQVNSRELAPVITYFHALAERERREREERFNR